MMIEPRKDVDIWVEPGKVVDNMMVVARLQQHSKVSNMVWEPKVPKIENESEEQRFMQSSEQSVLDLDWPSS